jgi:hypothetical protein
MADMSDWTTDELDRIGGARELRIAGRRADGSLRDPVIIWGVRVDGEYYVRSVKGTGAAWFRGTRPLHEGWISSAGVEKDVTFEDVDPADPVNERIDAVYRQKYGARSSSVTAITADLARQATLKVLPR